MWASWTRPDLGARQSSSFMGSILGLSFGPIKSETYVSPKENKLTNFSLDIRQVFLLVILYFTLRIVSELSVMVNQSLLYNLWRPFCIIIKSPFLNLLFWETIFLMDLDMISGF